MLDYFGIFFYLFRILDDHRVLPGPSSYPLHLRMIRITDDDHKISLFTFLPDDVVDLFHIGAGCVYDGNVFSLQLVVNPFFYSMGADDDRAPGEGIQLFLCPKDCSPPRLDILDHFLIVDDRAEGIDPFAAAVLQLPVYRINGTPHAEAEAGGFC